MADTSDLRVFGLYADEAVAAGLVASKASKLSLHVESEDDFDAELYKSDCALTSIPELGLEIPDGNSRLTTVRGLLIEIEQNLRNAPAVPGLDEFLAQLSQCISGTIAFHLQLDDALGLSWIRPPSHRKGQLVIVEEDRKSADEIYFELDRKSNHFNSGSSPIDALVSAIMQSSKIMILSGAGISTESGIPAFRSPDGMENIWDKYDPTLATYDAFQTQETARAEYWSMHGDLYEIVGKGALPNASHHLAVWLANHNKLSKVITQNIDGLYQVAGLNTRDLVELHGSITTSKCSVCHLEHDRAAVHQLWKSGIKVPLCESCGKPLKCGTISFGEPIPPTSLEAAFKEAKECDLMIIMGTSLVVQPANKLPQHALDQKVPVVLINIGSTPLDKVVDLKIASPCGELCGRLLERLEHHKTNKCTETDSNQIKAWLEMGLLEDLTPAQVRMISAQPKVHPKNS